jgi:hypothetical protein
MVEATNARKGTAFPVGVDISFYYNIINQYDTQQFFVHPEGNFQLTHRTIIRDSSIKAQ